MTGNIVWIASYPKSGNTWFRAFIANLVAASDSLVPINRLPADNGNTRFLFDAVTGMDSAHLLPEEADRLRPDLYRMISAASGSAPRFIKTHGAYRLLPDGRAVFPAEATRGTVCIVRNPLDIVPSYAHFLGWDCDRIIALMNEDGCVFNRERRDITRMLSQQYGNWSEHVLSWLEAPAGMGVHVMRYEDMLRAPAETFFRAVRAMGLEQGGDAIRRAVAAASFDTLRAMERNEGFRERPPRAGAFFRQGTSGSWRGVLTAAQVSAVTEKHNVVMQRLGYLDAHGNLVDS